MKNSIKDLNDQLVKGEKLTTEQLSVIKGGGGSACGSPTDPKRCR